MDPRAARGHLRPDHPGPRGIRAAREGDHLPGERPKFLATPLAFFRGFELASGVDLRKTSFLEHSILSKYFQRERLGRILETKAIAFAAAGNVKVAGELLGDLTKALIPELEQDLEDFRDRAAKAMPTWDDKVLAIERDARGRPSIKRYNVSDVEDELLAFAGMAEDRLRRMERGEKPPKGPRRRAQPPPKSFQPRKK